MNSVIAEACKETNIYLVITSLVLTLIVEWWLPKSRFKANSIGDIVIATIGLVFLLVAVVASAIFRRIKNGTSSGTKTRN